MEQMGCFLGFVIYLTGFSSSDQYESIHLGESYSWKQAMEACESKNSTLPKVRIIGDSFGLLNEHIQPENRCYWLRATYERAVNLTDDSYPSNCCEAMFTDERGTSIKNCGLCGEPNHYLCASESNTIAWSSSMNLPDAPWQKAVQYCTTHAHGLPSDTNAEFLRTLLFKRNMWVNGVRRLNLNPKQGDGMFPLCSCNGIVHLTCPSNTSTSCVPESMHPGRSDTSLSFTTPLSASSNVPRSSSGSHQASIHLNITITTGESMNTGISWTPLSFTTHSSASSDVPKTSSGSHQSSSDLGTTPTIQDNEALIGGVTGASVALIIIIITIIVVIFLFRRSKKTQNKNSNPQSPVNTINFLKGNIYAKAAYDDVVGKFPDTNKQVSLKMQNLEKESITYVNPGKVKGSSEITRDNYSGTKANKEQSKTAMYSLVQKGPKIGQKLNNMKQDVTGIQEYDKINFDTSYEIEHSGHVYDKTNFRPEPREKQSENVYDKAIFYLEPRDMDGGNAYATANFHAKPQDQQSENVYAKANFHREIQGEHSGNVYAKSNFKRDPRDEPSEN